MPMASPPHPGRSLLRDCIEELALTIAEAAVASAKSDGLAPTVGVASIHSSGRIRCGRCSIVMNIRNSVTIARVG